jgi:hypothetical protein
MRDSRSSVGNLGSDERLRVPALSKQHDIELLLRVLLIGLEADGLAEELLQLRDRSRIPRR